MVGHASRLLTEPTSHNASGPRVASTSLQVHAESHPATTDARILGVLEVLARDLEKPQSVKYFAAQLRLSASRFEHLFKDQTGLAFKAFLLAARMTRAKNMLKDRTLRIKEVAAAVGYANVSNFIRDYTKRYGESPSQSRSSSLRDSLIPFSSRRGVPGGGPR